MTFTDISFIFMWLPLMVFAHRLAAFKGLHNYVLCFFSCILCFWIEPTYAWLLFLITFINYLTARLVERHHSKGILITWIAALVFLLGYFKYTNFLFTTINQWLNTGLLTKTMIMPLGISFFTFQSIAYVVDVYKGKTKAETNVLNMLTFFTFFPSITSGPILRYEPFRQQLIERDISNDNLAEGMRRFITGAFKKVVLANQLAIIADYGFGHIDNLGFILAWGGAVCYMMQIYLDFSGYSDMALGIARMLGFSLPENFNFPYMATSVQDFWRRWHISLSQWFRDYIYIPLGGNRVSTPRWIFNIFVVWSLTGLWHGASFTFITWGLYFGVLLVLEKYARPYLDKVPTLLRRIITLLIVMISWIIFKSADLGSAVAYMKQLVNFRHISNLMELKLLDILYLYPVVIIGMIACTPLFRKALDRLKDRNIYIHDLIMIILLVITIIMVINSTYSPFIYFNF